MKTYQVEKPFNTPTRRLKEGDAVTDAELEGRDADALAVAGYLSGSGTPKDSSSVSASGSSARKRKS